MFQDCGGCAREVGTQNMIWKKMPCFSEVYQWSSLPDAIYTVILCNFLFFFFFCPIHTFSWYTMDLQDCLFRREQDIPVSKLTIMRKHEKGPNNNSYCQTSASLGTEFWQNSFLRLLVMHLREQFGRITTPEICAFLQTSLLTLLGKSFLV